MIRLNGNYFYVALAIIYKKSKNIVFLCYNSALQKITSNKGIIVKIAIINGPNLNMLGIREKNIYGALTLKQINEGIEIFIKNNALDIGIDFFQSNLEGEIIDKIQECAGTTDGIIINPAAYSHTSLAIKDALNAVSVPSIEVHISNIHQRETIRHNMVTAGASLGVIAGLGGFSYHLALMAMHQFLKEQKPTTPNTPTQEA